MGSDSDWPTLKAAADACAEFDVPHEVRVVSAHRTPTDMANYARSAHKRGLRAIISGAGGAGPIAGAGGAALLRGVGASHTPLPVIGVPIETKALKGLDSLLSIAQMPAGVPVGTLAIGEPGAKNAALLAISILALRDEKFRRRGEAFRAKQTRT